MLNLYKIQPFLEGYEFTNAAGDKYYTYFTPFTLQTSDHTIIETTSFGFECKRADPETRLFYDDLTKRTIVHIIEEYFRLNKEDALLYICLNNHGMARHRNITFSNWFNELGQGYERHKSKVETEKLNFYSSILVKESNPDKAKLIDAFHFTIDYWFPEE